MIDQMVSSTPSLNTLVVMKTARTMATTMMMMPTQKTTTNPNRWRFVMRMFHKRFRGSAMTGDVVSATGRTLEPTG